MQPSSASVVALLLVAAALSVVLSARDVSPRVDPALDIELDPVEQGERPAKREQRRSAERRSSPTPARTPGRARTPEPARTPAPARAVAAPVQTPVATREAAAPAAADPEPAAVVTAYYRALDARRFDEAWKTLSPAVRTAFGGFDPWRTGYGTTLASRPHGIAVQRDGSVAGIAHELVTEDRSPCGPVRRRFAVRWRLALGPDGWRAVSLTAVKRSGAEPAAACPPRHDAARAAGGR